MAARQQQANTFADYINNIDQQIAYFQKLKQEAASNFRQLDGNNGQYEQHNSLWSQIDAEFTNIDKYVSDTITKDERYVSINAQLQSIIQQELLYLVRDKVESRQDGKALLEKQLQVVKEIKSSAVDKRNKDIDLFNRFKEYSRLHPETTYEEFLTKTF